MKDLSFRGPPSVAIAEGASTPNPGIGGVTIWSTSSLKTLYWDSNRNKWLALRGGALNSYDIRSLKPNDLEVGSVRSYFASKAGMEGGAAVAPYVDVLALNSYNDSTGGGLNAIAFNKSTQAMYHYFAGFASTAWSAPKQIAYTDSNITGSAATLTTPRKINDVSFNGSTDITVPTIYDANFTRIVNPGGGSYVTTAGVVTGALTITPPVVFSSTMLRATIKVYQYITNKSFEIAVGGYAYSAGGSWINPFAYLIGNPSVALNLTIRLGKNAAGFPVIYIGELDSTWSYPQVFVTEVQLGYSGYSNVNWTKGWTIGFTTAAFESVTNTIANPQVGYYSTTNVANSYVYRDANGDFAAGKITVGAFRSASPIQFLTLTSQAQGIQVAGICVSNSYSDTYPLYGAYIKGVIQSGVADGTAPLVVLSKTQVTNLKSEFSGTADNVDWTGVGNKPTDIANITARLAEKANLAVGNAFVGNNSFDGTVSVKNTTVTADTVTIDGSTAAGFKVQNAYGYVSIAPLNGSFAHIYTDRASFIFNKDISTTTNTFASYNSDFVIKRVGATKLTLGTALASFVDPVYAPTFNYALLANRSITDNNTATTSGLVISYSPSGATNKPPGTDHSVITMNFSAAWSNQMAADWRTNTWYVRNQNNSVWGAWETILTSGKVKTVGGQSLLGSGDIAITSGGTTIDPGVVVMAAGTPSGGWLELNGSTYLQSSYSALFAKLGLIPNNISTPAATWTLATLSAGYDWSDITTNGTIFVAVAPGTKVATSTDGLSWTLNTCPSGFWKAVKYLNGYFFAFAGQSNGVMRSSDGVNWSAVTSLPINFTTDNIVVDGGLFYGDFYIFVGAGTLLFKSSDNGSTWTQQLSSPYTISGIAYKAGPTKNELIVGYSNYNYVNFTNNGGSTWTTWSMGYSTTGLLVTDDYFFLFYNTIILRSAGRTESETWTTVSNITSGTLSGGAYGDGVIVVPNANTNFSVSSSSDFTTNTYRTTTLPNNTPVRVRIAYKNNMFVAVNGSDKCVTATGSYGYDINTSFYVPSVDVSPQGFKSWIKT